MRDTTTSTILKPKKCTIGIRDEELHSKNNHFHKIPYECLVDDVFPYLIITEIINLSMCDSFLNNACNYYFNEMKNLIQIKKWYELYGFTNPVNITKPILYFEIFKHHTNIGTLFNFKLTDEKFSNYLSPPIQDDLNYDSDNDSDSDNSNFDIKYNDSKYDGEYTIQYFKPNLTHNKKIESKSSGYTSDIIEPYNPKTWSDFFKTNSANPNINPNKSIEKTEKLNLCEMDIYVKLIRKNKTRKFCIPKSINKPYIIHKITVEACKNNDIDLLKCMIEIIESIRTKCTLLCECYIYESTLNNSKDCLIFLADYLILNNNYATITNGFLYSVHCNLKEMYDIYMSKYSNYIRTTELSKYIGDEGSVLIYELLSTFDLNTEIILNSSVEKGHFRLLKYIFNREIVTAEHVSKYRINMYHIIEHRSIPMIKWVISNSEYFKPILTHNDLILKTIDLKFWDGFKYLFNIWCLNPQIRPNRPNKSKNRIKLNIKLYVKKICDLGNLTMLKWILNKTNRLLTKSLIKTACFHNKFEIIKYYYETENIFAKVHLKVLLRRNREGIDNMNCISYIIKRMNHIPISLKKKMEEHRNEFTRKNYQHIMKLLKFNSN